MADRLDMEHWFMYVDEVIKGPFNTEQLKAQVSAEDFVFEAFIWGNSQDVWLKSDQWLKELDKPKKSSAEDTDERVWHYAYEGTSVGPLAEMKLIDELKDVKNIDSILLWSKGMKKWESVFEFHNIVEALGCTRRAHPRADIEGSVVVHYDNHVSIGQLKQISVGGLGATNLSVELKKDMEVKVEIKSQHFYEPINAIAHVQYIGDNGFFGLKFYKIQMESQSKIIQYIKQKNNKRFTEAA